MAEQKKTVEASPASLLLSQTVSAPSEAWRFFQGESPW